MEIKLSNGTVLKGEPKQLADTLLALGQLVDDGVHYMSESQGLVKIADMHPRHVRNAICKLYRDWADGLNKIEDDSVFLARMHDGPNDKTMMALIANLHLVVNKAGGGKIA